MHTLFGIGPNFQKIMRTLNQRVQGSSPCVPEGADESGSFAEPPSRIFILLCSNLWI